MSNERSYNVTISNTELHESTDTMHHEAVRDIAALMMLDAAIGAQLNKSNDCADNNDYVTADKLSDSLSVQVSFGQYSASVNLSCMDTYDAFCRFIQKAICNIDLYYR